MLFEIHEHNVPFKCCRFVMQSHIKKIMKNIIKTMYTQCSH